jgi:hypothetical protein
MITPNFDKFENTIWLDCDGVLANFDKRAAQVLGMKAQEYEDKHGSDKFWAALADSKDFFFSLELMPEAIALYYSVKHLSPVILTGSPFQMGEKGRVQKFRWLAKHFGYNQRAVICQSKLKYLYCLPGDIIIDDSEKHKVTWEEAGGHWITHKTNKETREKLELLNVF